MGSIRLGITAAFLLVALGPTIAHAQTAQAGAGASANASVSTTTTGTFDNYSVRLGLEGAGPLLFRDAPDARVEQTTVFQFGPRLGFLFGHELKDVHRFGLGLSYLPTAKSNSRNLTFIPIYLMYETGHPLVLQATLGANVTSGSVGLAGKYAGVHTGLALRYSFLAGDRWSPVTVSPGIAARANLSTDSMQYSSVFLGAQLEIAYNSNN